MKQQTGAEYTAYLILKFLLLI